MASALGLPAPVLLILNLAIRAQGYTQYALAARLGCSPQRLWRILHGLTLPTEAEWIQLCRELRQESLVGVLNGDFAPPATVTFPTGASGAASAEAAPGTEPAA